MFSLYSYEYISIHTKIISRRHLYLEMCKFEAACTIELLLIYTISTDFMCGLFPYGELLHYTPTSANSTHNAQRNIHIIFSFVLIQRGHDLESFGFSYTITPYCSSCDLVCFSRQVQTRKEYHAIWMWMCFRHGSLFFVFTFVTLWMQSVCAPCLLFVSTKLVFYVIHSWFDTNYPLTFT